MLSLTVRVRSMWVVYQNDCINQQPGRLRTRSFRLACPGSHGRNRPAAAAPRHGSSAGENPHPWPSLPWRSGLSPGGRQGGLSLLPDRLSCYERNFTIITSNKSFGDRQDGDANPSIHFDDAFSWLPWSGTLTVERTVSDGGGWGHRKRSTHGVSPTPELETTEIGAISRNRVSSSI